MPCPGPAAASRLTPRPSSPPEPGCTGDSSQLCWPHSWPSCVEGPGPLLALPLQARTGPSWAEKVPLPQRRGVTCYSRFFLRRPFRELRPLSGLPGGQLGSVWWEDRQGSRTGIHSLHRVINQTGYNLPPGQMGAGLWAGGPRSGQSRPREVIHGQKRVILGQGPIGCTRDGQTAGKG